MKLNKLNIKSNIFFISQVLFSLLYLTFFFEVAKQVWESCSAILFKVIIQNSSFSDIFKQKVDFYIYIIGFIFVLTIAIRIIFALIKLCFTVFKTRQYLSKLEVIAMSSRNEIIFNANAIEIFTAGFLKPKIYISSKAVETFTNEERDVLFFHEYNHKRNFDPLKDLVVGLIYNIIFFVPFRSYIKDKYRIIKELAADESIIYSNSYNVQNIIELVSKISLTNKRLAVSSYTDSIDRLEYIIGKRNFKFSYVMVTLFYFCFITFVAISKINAASTFNHCADPSKCQSILQDQSSSSILVEICEVRNSSPLINKSQL